MSCLKVILLAITVSSVLCQHSLIPGVWYGQRTSFSQQLGCYRLEAHYYTYRVNAFEFVETFILRGLENQNDGFLVFNATSRTYTVFNRQENRTGNEVNVTYSSPLLLVTEVIINGTNTGSRFCLTPNRNPTLLERITLQSVCNSTVFFDQSQDGC